MAGERRGKRIDDLPAWAKRFAKEYGSEELEGRGDVFFGPLIDRRSGLRKDDLIELLIDARAIRSDDEPWDETWRALIDNAKGRVKPYFRLHDRLLHNAMDISEGKPHDVWRVVRTTAQHIHNNVRGVH